MDSSARLEELQMIRCSLLPEEILEFVYDSEFWGTVLDDAPMADVDALSKSEAERFGSATFTLKVTSVDEIWLQVTMPIGAAGAVSISVKSDTLPRAEVDSWQRMVNERLEEGVEEEFALYNTLSSHILPLLHEYEPDHTHGHAASDGTRPQPSSPFYHVFFNSHHLISPNKRKQLRHWTSSLSLSGFAKIGYPGIIYAQGPQENLEEFVANVKAMQWLALKVRFVERLPTRYLEKDSEPLVGWREFQRVGKVVEEMKRLGREEFVFEMGIGSSGN